MSDDQLSDGYRAEVKGHGMTQTLGCTQTPSPTWQRSATEK